MNPKLALIQRRLDRQTPERIPVPESGSLGAAIDALVQQAVQEQVAETLEKQTPPKKVRDLFNAPEPFTDYRQIPPTPKAPAPRKPVRSTIQRDGAGLARAMVIDGPTGTIRYIIQRDSAGQVIGFATDEVASEVTYDGQPVPPPNARD